MYYLSELYGRIGQILKEQGDMPVVRPVYYEIDGLCSKGPFYFNLNNNCFESQVVKVYSDNVYQYKEKRFVIDSLFNDKANNEITSINE